MQETSSATEAKTEGGALIGAAGRAEWLCRLAVVISSLIVFGFLFNRETTLSYSIGYNLYAAERVLSGEVPYRDFHTLYPPATLYVNAAVFKLLGISLFNALAGVLVFKVLTALSLYVCARQVLNRALALTSVALSLVWLRPNGPFKAVPMHYGALFLALAVGLLLADRVQRRSALLFAAGVALGILALFKHNIGAYALIGSIAAVAPGEGKLRFNTPFLTSNWRRAMALVAGFVLGLVPVVGYMLAQRALLPMGRTLLLGPGDFLVSRLAASPSPLVPVLLAIGLAVLAAMIYLLRSRAGASAAIALLGVALLGRFLLSSEQALVDPIIFYAPVAVLAAGLAVCARTQNWRELFIVVVGAAAAFLESFPRFAREQAIAAMPFVMVLVLYLVSRAGERISSVVGNGGARVALPRKLAAYTTAAYATIGLVPLMFLLMGGRLFFNTFFEGGIRLKSNTPVTAERARGVYFPRVTAQEIDDVIRYVQDRVPEGGHFFPHSSAGSSFLFLADRSNPSGAQFWGGVGVSERERRETLDALEAARVQLIVTSDKDLASERYQPMQEYIDQHFEVSKRFGEVLILERRKG